MRAASKYYIPQELNSGKEVNSMQTMVASSKGNDPVLHGWPIFTISVLIKTAKLQRTSRMMNTTD
jgi:hypothetical protein